MNLNLIEAEDGQQAVSKAEQYQPDIILMDISMPVMDGIEAAKKIRRGVKCQVLSVKEKNNLNTFHLTHNTLPITHNTLPIIALTARAMAQEKERIMSAGFDGFLTKPVQRAELFKELSRFIAYSEKSEKCEVRSEKHDGEGLLPEIVEKLPEIVERLENEFSPLCSSALESGNFADIEHFANQIRDFGEQYSLNTLIVLGKNLLEHVGNFDIENIEIVLNSYPKRVEEIRTIGKKT